jgi:hypothetical protein
MLIRVKLRDRGKRIWLEMGSWPADWVVFLFDAMLPRTIYSRAI